MDVKIRFCSYSELKKTQYITKWVDELRDEVSAYLDKDNNVHTFSSICPHQGGDFKFDKKTQTIECKWHGLKYCPKSLECVNRNYKVKLFNYSNKIENDDVIILIS